MVKRRQHSQQANVWIHFTTRSRWFVEYKSDRYGKVAGTKGPRNLYCNTLLNVGSRSGWKRLFKSCYPKMVQVEYNHVNNSQQSNYSYYAPGGTALNYTQHYRNM